MWNVGLTSEGVDTLDEDISIEVLATVELVSEVVAKWLGRKM